MTNWRSVIGKELEEDDYLESLKNQAARVRGERVEQEVADRRAKEDRTPIIADQWIGNEYFCGSFARTMYPKLKELFIEIVEKRVHIVIMGGATRYGKTTLAVALQGRSEYEVNCDWNPQRNLGIQDESNLLYLNMNVTGQKARDAYFTKLSAWVRSTKYFQQEFPPKPNVFLQLQHPKNVLCKFSGAIRKAAESEDLFYFVGDEVNLYDIVEQSKRAKSGDKFDAAEEIDTEVSRRMQGTFMRADGTYPSACKILWLCKETYPDSFIRRKMEEVRRDGLIDQGEAYIIESSEWGMKPMRCKQCNAVVDEKAHECARCSRRVNPTDYFWIRTPSRKDSARIIDDRTEAEAEMARVAKLEAQGAPGDEMFDVMAVPTVYRPIAAKQAPGALEGFIRDMCGVPTQAISVFFQEREPIYNAIRRGGESIPGVKRIPSEVCAHPFTGMATSTRDGIRLIKERLARQVKTGKRIPVLDPKTKRALLDPMHGTPVLEDEIIWTPIIHPEQERFIGVDAGLTGDPCGITMGHRCGWKTVLRYNDDNEPVEEQAPVTWIDFMMRIIPPPNGQIPFSGIRGLIYMMVQLGFAIGKITCDSFQHVALSQPLEDRGYEVEIVSVDRTPDAYNLMHLAYYEGRVSAYEYPIYEREVTELERIVTGNIMQGRPVEKIDHPPAGTKDIADSCAQVVSEVEKAAIGLSVYDNMRPGAIEAKASRPLVAEHEERNKYMQAFAEGDLDAMRLMDEEQKGDWEW